MWGLSVYTHACDVINLLGVFILANLQLYSLCDILYKEARLVRMTAELVYREDIQQQQRQGATQVSARLHSLWEEYRTGAHSACFLLSAGSRLTCPRLTMDDRDAEGEE